MRAGKSAERGVFDPVGAYHGHQEGYAQIFFWIAMVEMVMFLAMPWLDVRLLNHAPNPPRGNHLVGLAIAANVLCLAGVSTFLQVYRGLSRHIATGGTEAMYLDGIRLSLATMVGSLLFAGIALHMVGVWSPS